MRRLLPKGGSIISVAISGIVIAVIIVSFYYYLSHRFSSYEEEYSDEKSELELVLSKDFLNEYPDTPKHVMEWYNRILMLYYSDETDDREVEALCDQARMLVDQEVLDKNPRLDYISAVKQEKERYKARGRRISSATVVNVVTGTKDRRDMAGVTVLYAVQEKSVFSNFYQTYNLRRDGSGKYKVYTFALTDDEGNPIAGEAMTT